MARKRYEVRGMMEWHPVFKVGRSCLQVSFTGGHMCGGASSPASFETSDPAVQAIIEGSPAYRAGRITIGMEMEDTRSDGRNVGALRGTSSCAYGAAVRMTALHNPDNPDNYNVMVFESEVEARDFLTVTKGVASDRLGDVNACIEEARKLGIALRINQRTKL